MYGEQPENMKKTVKEYFDIQARDSQKRKALGICLVYWKVNPALDVVNYHV